MFDLKDLGKLIRLEPLALEERGDLFKKIYSLQNYPTSQRIFTELFDKAKEIVETKGIKKGWIRKKRSYLDFSVQNKGISMDYCRNFIFEGIILELESPDIDLVLERVRGHQSGKRLDNLDITDMAMRASDLEEIGKGLHRYEPYCLSIIDFKKFQPRKLFFY
jgi:hypothetical protein